MMVNMYIEVINDWWLCLVLFMLFVRLRNNVIVVNGLVNGSNIISFRLIVLNKFNIGGCYFVCFN